MFRRTAKVIIFNFMMLALASMPASAESVSSKVKKGNAAYGQDQFEKASQEYSQALEKNTESDIINYDLGAALYKQGEFARSIEAFNKSLLTEDDHLKQKVHYNLGNALYKEGMAHEDKDIQAAIAQIEKAVGQYEKAAAMDEADADSKSNLEFVRKELERLKEKEQQQEQKQDKQDQNQKDQKQDQQDKKDQQDKQQSQEDQKDQKPSEDQKQQQSSSEDKQDSQSSQDKDQMSQPKEEQQDSSAGKNKEEQETQEQQEQQEQQKVSQESDNQKDGQNAQAQRSSGKPAKDQTALPMSGMLEPGQFTEKEAQMILEQYQQSEEPKGLLNVNRNRGSAEAVYKDW